MMRDQSQSDGRLIARMRAGDESAARLLWSLYSARLTAYADAILARAEPGGGADVVQQAFLAAIRVPRREAREVGDAGAWLIRLTRNLALNRVRCVRRERGRTQVGTSGACGLEDPRGDGEALARALAGLPRPLREVVTLKHSGGLTFDQMELVLGVSRNTLAARYRRAIELLRASLGAGEESGGPVSAERKELAHARP